MKIMVSCGGHQYLDAMRIIAILLPRSRTAKRMKAQAVKKTKLIDLCLGKPIRSVIIMQTGYVAVSTLRPVSLVSRITHLVKLFGEEELE